MRLSIILRSESDIQIKVPWAKTALMFSNTFLRPACQIQKLGQAPQAENHDALTKPLASVLHVKGSAIKLLIKRNVRGPVSFQNKAS